MSTLLILCVLLVLVCKTQEECAEGDLRLTEPVETNITGGTVVEVTFVEYCFAMLNEWRVICDHSYTWTQSAAEVACRQLGYSDKGVEYGSGCYGNSMRTSVQVGMPCTGFESKILDCGGIISLQICSCGSHAWISCQPNCINGEIRLVDGLIQGEGRVEVCVDGRWGTVCNNQEGLAGAVCAQLGLPAEGTYAITKYSPGNHSLPIASCPVQSESNFSCTQITDASCDHSMDLGVLCQQTTSFQGGDKDFPNVSMCESCPTAALGAIVGILVVLQAVTLLGWIATCFRKRLMTSISQRETDVKTCRNDSYHLQQPHTSEANNEATPTQANYSTSGPKYATVADRIDCYDVIGLNQQAPPTVKPEHAPVEASKKDDDFYNAEEHTYAMIDKKKSKKKAPKDKKEVGDIEEGAK